MVDVKSVNDSDDVLYDLYIFGLVRLVTYVLRMALGLVPSLFVGVDVWRAFRKKKHWIPNDALLLTAFTVQLFSFLAILTSSEQSTLSVLDRSTCSALANSVSDRFMIQTVRVIACVSIGILLPGVARPRSPNLWGDIMALLITPCVVLLHILYEICLSFMCIRRTYDDYSIGMLRNQSITICILTVLMLLLPGCAALASVSVNHMLALKIPLILSTVKCKSRSCSQQLWNTVEEQVHKSWIIVLVCNPQYIIARSYLSSSIAVIVTICILVATPLYFCGSFSCNFENSMKTWFEDEYIEVYIQCGFILVGWIVICWRCLTAVIYFPRTMERRAFHFRQCFHVEDFWKRHLLKLIDEFKEQVEIEGSFLKRLVVKSIRTMQLHKLLPLVIWLQILLVLLNKASWYLSQMLFSNHYSRRILIGSVYKQFSHLYKSKIPENGVQDSGFSSFVKYSEAFIHMPGENPASLWIANHKSIEKMKNRIKKGEEEGKSHDALIKLLGDRISQGFGGVKYMDPMAFAPELQVDRQLINVTKRSWKMTAVSLITVIIELSSFTDNGSAVTDAMEACSQAWKIMDFVEKSDPEAALVNEAADKVFYRLHKTRKWLHYHLPLTNSTDKTSEAAKEAIHNLAEKGKNIAMADRPGQDSRDWKTLAAGYSLYRICERVKCRLNNVEAMLDELQQALANVIGECVEKVAGVIMEDCREWALSMDEEKVWKAGLVAGKAKGVIESVGWKLKWTHDGVRVQSRKEVDDDIEVGNVRNR
eukprot:Gb_33570 [translate_table: standard]